MSNENNSNEDTLQDTTVEESTVVCDVPANQSGDVESTISDVMRQYDVAHQMHRKLNDKYVGIKVAIHQPLAGSTSGELDEVAETFGDNAKVILNTFPSYITDLGKSIASKARNLVRENSAKVPSTNGHLVHKDKIRSVETGLLSFKGIEQSDRMKYDAEMIADAEEAINIRLSNRKGIYKDENIPVTFIGYCDYVAANFDTLINQILAEYGENSFKIENSLPNRSSLARASFEWYHFAEVPALMMYGETSLRDIIDGMRREEQAEERIKASVESEIVRFQTQCQDAVGAVQQRVRSEIAQQLKDFVDRASQERTYRRDGGEVTLPRNITESSLNKLSSRIDSLTTEISGVADNDEFFRTVQEFKQQLSGIDMDNTEVRANTTESAERIIEMCLDTSAIDQNTGQYFASII